LRDDATTTQKRMDEVVRADFRASPKRTDDNGILPRAEFVRSTFLLVEEKAAGRPGGQIRGSAGDRALGSGANQRLTD